MKGVKIFFWTTIFWLLVVAVIFGYAKYVKSGQNLANTIAKMVGVTPAMEMTMDDEATAMSSELASIQNQLSVMQNDLQALLQLQLMANQESTIPMTGDQDDENNEDGQNNQDESNNTNTSTSDQESDDDTQSESESTLEGDNASQSSEDDSSSDTEKQTE